MRKKIILFGAGKSATCLIDYLLQQCEKEDWNLLLIDANLELAKSKIAGSNKASALSIDVQNSEERIAVIKQAAIVISLLPAALHFLVAKDCVTFEKNLLTASYADELMRSLEPAIIKKKLLFVCEMGLDPGIDHMSAMQLLHHIKDQQGIVHSFVSHCGGLVAPESDNNPWHYKISWNPRNVVLAGKAGATYKEKNSTKRIEYADLFKANKMVSVSDLGNLAYYPNRDSLDYIPLYQLEKAERFIRTTLRHPDFCLGWNYIIALQLTEETPRYQTDGISLQEFFIQHCKVHGFTEQILALLNSANENFLENIIDLLLYKQDLHSKTNSDQKDFMPLGTDATGAGIHPEERRLHAMIRSKLLEQFRFLGLEEKNTIINKGFCSAADVLQFMLENKLILQPVDKDMIVMLHEIDYSVGVISYNVKSELVVKGEDHLRTAMAKTVGLPIGIATTFILKGQLPLTGLHIPVIPEIYEPVLDELQRHGISFRETVRANPS